MSHHGFRWSKKAKITLATIGFWQNISNSIFKFAPFLYAMKACQWNLVNFFKICKRFDKSREKKIMLQSIRKEKLRQVGICFITGSFITSFRVGLSPFQKICIICLIESSLNMMKNAFYFILKALFVLQIFKFLSWIFGHVEKTAWLEI